MAEDTITALRRATEAAAAGRQLAPDAAEQAWVAARGPRRSPATWLAVAATVVVVAGAAVALAVWRPGSSGGGRSAGAGGSACTGAVTDTPLPTWARDGFTPPDSPQAHVTGAHGRIVAVLFARPLRVHQPAGTYNKVLWVARSGSGGAPLVIRAALEGTQQTARRTVPGGPGPSYLDLPRAGCWRLSLSWGGEHDTVAVPYSP